MMRRAVVVPLIVILTVFAAYGGGATRGLTEFFGDLRFASLPRTPSGQIVLIDFDKKSLDAIGIWPWPRRIHAQITRKLVDAEARGIAFDVDFSAHSSATEDQAFAEALREAEGSVILAVFNQPVTSAGDARVVANRPIPAFADNSWPATVNVRADPDGVVRKFSYAEMIGGEVIPSIAAMFGTTDVRRGEFRIDYGIRATGIDRIPAIDLLRDEVDRSRLSGKNVIVGASAAELRDFFQIPNAGLVSGPMLEALAAETLIQDRALKPLPAVAVPLGLGLLAAVSLLLARRRGLKHKLAVLVGLSVAGEALATVLQATHPVFIETGPWHLALAGLALAAVALEIDFRRILIAIHQTETTNVRTLLQRVLEDSFEGVVVVDAAERILFANPMAATLLGAEGSVAWVARPAADCLPRDFVAAIRQAVLDCAAGSRPGEPRLWSTVAEDGSTRILEYVVTCSQLSGGLTRAGAPLPDVNVASLTFRDVSEAKAALAQLSVLAHRDSVTGLPNRNRFCELLEEAMCEGAAAFAVLSFDLDRFKTINDTFGHAFGDKLLQSVAERATEIVGEAGTVARFGGDEFAVLQKGPVLYEDAETLARTLVRELIQPYEIDGRRIFIGASVGYVVSSEAEASGPDGLLVHADMALYTAKAIGGGAHRGYDRAMEARVLLRKRLELELRDGLQNGEFEVYYQPQMDLATRLLTGVEALVRWNHPERGLVSPLDFITIAEEIGFIEELGGFVLAEACSEVARWPGPVKVAVNVSPVQFLRGELEARVAAALAASGLPATQLALEITESLFVQDEARLAGTMHNLRELGIEFALDDFGTGYSSLSYIRQFPVDKIKIDRTFVKGLPEDDNSIAIIRAVTALSQSLGIRTIAEGVETEEQLQAVHLLGCQEIQGYLVGKPLPAHQVRQMFHDQMHATALSAAS